MTVNTIAVAIKLQMLPPVPLICWTFIPNIEEAKLVGMKMKARIVTFQRQSAKARCNYEHAAGRQLTESDTFSLFDRQAGFF